MCQKCTPLMTYLRRMQTGATSPAVPSVVIRNTDQRQTLVNSDTVIVIPQYVNFPNVIVNIASLGVPLKPADYQFNQSQGKITIYNYQLTAQDAVYLIPAN